MKTKRLPERRKFAGPWDEIEYLSNKLLYWLYQRLDRRKSRSYAERLAQKLAEADPNHDSILGEECWSLIFEAKGDLQKAIQHRKNEIQMIRRLHEISKGTPGERIVLNRYGINALSDRLDLLAILQHESGELDKALNTLLESKRLCEDHGIRFDGADVLRAYLEEKNNRRKRE